MKNRWKRHKNTTNKWAENRQNLLIWSQAITCNSFYFVLNLKQFQSLMDHCNYDSSHEFFLIKMYMWLHYIYINIL